MDGHRYTALFEAPGGQPITKAYPDPLTKGDPWTISLGITGPDIKEGTEWPEARCWAEYYNRYAVASGEAAHLAGTSRWSALSDQRRAVLTDMAFQMGAHGLAMFQKMLTAIHAGNWQEAAGQMKDSQYHGQTPFRCETNAQTLLTGEWPSP